MFYSLVFLRTFNFLVPKYLLDDEMDDVVLAKVYFTVKYPEPPLEQSKSEGQSVSLQILKGP